MKMTEFEYFEALNMVYTGVPTSAMNFVYLVFAYIVASYLAGKNLPRYIAVSGSIVYTLALIGPFVGVVGGINQIFHIVSEYSLAYPNRNLVQINFQNSFWMYFITLAPLLIGWFASLLFLHLFIRSDHNEESQFDT